MIGILGGMGTQAGLDFCTKLAKLNRGNVDQKYPIFVRMTGSGSVIIAYYQLKRDCELAKVQFKRKFKNYWCNTSKTI